LAFLLYARFIQVFDLADYSGLACNDGEVGGLAARHKIDSRNESWRRLAEYNKMLQHILFKSH